MKTYFKWTIWKKAYPHSRKIIPSIDLQVNLVEWALPLAIEYWHEYERISVQFLCIALHIWSGQYLFPFYYKHYYDRRETNIAGRANG